MAEKDPVKQPLVQYTAAYLLELAELKAANPDLLWLEGYMNTLYAWAYSTKPQLIYEIGVDCGYSTCAFLHVLSLTGGRLLSCDILDCSQAVRGAALLEHWCFMQMPSTELASRLIQPAQIVYVDGDHKYNAVRADVEAFWPLLQPGGMMILHDAYLGECNPGKIADRVASAGVRVSWHPDYFGFAVLHKAAADPEILKL